MARKLVIFFSLMICIAVHTGAATLPDKCDELCNCKIGPAYCAKVQSRLGPHQMQYPGCLNSCFSNCCKSNATLLEITEGMCTDNVFVEVVTGSHNGPVGLVEPCPEIFLAAINRQKII